MKAYDILKNAVEALGADIAKADKGNASAQRRVRTAVPQLVKLVKELKADYPAAKKAEE